MQKFNEKTVVTCRKVDQLLSILYSKDSTTPQNNSFTGNTNLIFGLFPLSQFLNWSKLNTAIQIISNRICFGDNSRQIAFDHSDVLFEYGITNKTV